MAAPGARQCRYWAARPLHFLAHLKRSGTTLLAPIANKRCLRHPHNGINTTKDGPSEHRDRFLVPQLSALRESTATTNVSLGDVDYVFIAFNRAAQFRAKWTLTLPW